VSQLRVDTRGDHSSPARKFSDDYVVNSGRVFFLSFVWALRPLSSQAYSLLSLYTASRCSCDVHPGLSTLLSHDYPCPASEERGLARGRKQPRRKDYYAFIDLPSVRAKEEEETEGGRNP